MTTHRFRNPTEKIDAWQHTPGHNPSEQPPSVKVMATSRGPVARVQPPGTNVLLEAFIGDWVVTFPDGIVAVLNNHAFSMLYEAVPEEDSNAH